MTDGACDEGSGLPSSRWISFFNPSSLLGLFASEPQRVSELRLSFDLRRLFLPSFSLSLSASMAIITMGKSSLGFCSGTRLCCSNPFHDSASDLHFFFFFLTFVSPPPPGGRYPCFGPFRTGRSSSRSSSSSSSKSFVSLAAKRLCKPARSAARPFGFDLLWAPSGAEALLLSTEDS